MAVFSCFKYTAVGLFCQADNRHNYFVFFVSLYGGAKTAPFRCGLEQSFSNLLGRRVPG